MPPPKPLVNVYIDHLPRDKAGVPIKSDYRYILLHRFYNELMVNEFHGDEIEDVSVYVPFL